MEQCKLCSRLLDNPNDPLSRDCGGDCLYSMATIGEDTSLAIDPAHRLDGSTSEIPNLEHVVVVFHIFLRRKLFGESPAFSDLPVFHSV